MYLRITRARFAPARYEEVVPLAREVTAAVRQLPGFRHYHGGINRARGAIAAVSVWDTEEHARFSRDALGEVMERLRAVGVLLEPPEFYELVE